MRRATLPILLTALALAGCARSSDYWYRAASTPDQASADERDCRREATEVARARSRDDARLMEDRTNNDYGYGSASVFSSDLNVNRYEQLASAERDNIRDLTRACMADRGYRLKNDD
jgi:hypothetical protein